MPEDKVVWALAHPVFRGYIQFDKGIGHQDCNLIVTRDNEPVEVDLNELPTWAKMQVISSVHNRELLNSGDPIVSIKKEEKADTKPEPKESKTTKKKTTRKKQTRRKKVEADAEAKEE